MSDLQAELVIAEAELAKAEAAYAPAQKALEKAQARKEANAQKDRAAVLAAIEVRDPARIAVMNAQDRVADLRAGLGLQPSTIGKAVR
jgi:hypothetical protein